MPGACSRSGIRDGMPAVDVVEIVAAVADALDYAHQRNLLHRDVKPANILLANPGSPEARILLADFGIARWVDDPSGLTATNMTVGTVSYAAPEQLMGGTLDGRADQYALAATAFHLLTGVPPFQNSNPAVVISQHLSAAPPAIGDRRPELAALDPVFAKALAKDPKDRYERCADFARALRHRLGERRLRRDAAAPPRWRHPSRSAGRRCGRASSCPSSWPSCSSPPSASACSSDQGRRRTGRAPNGCHRHHVARDAAATPSGTAAVTARVHDHHGDHDP